MTRMAISPRFATRTFVNMAARNFTRANRKFRSQSALQILMRRVSLLLALVAVALVWAMPASAGAVLQSDNVELVTKLPEAVGAIGARFSPDGKYMYVTTAKGLHVYDVSDPADPQRTGVLPLPHFENEDVDAGPGFVVITNDPSFSTVGVIYIVDVHDPAAPFVRSQIVTEAPTQQVRDAVGAHGTNNGHISNCIQNCRYIWTTGSSDGITVYDLGNLDAPKFVGTFKMPVPKNRGGEPTDSPGFTHDVFVDRSGIGWITGEDGTFGYRTTGDPVHPELLYRSDENVTNSNNSGPSLDGASANGYPLDFLHHNSIRTSIQLAPRPAAPAAALAPAAGGSTPKAKAKRKVGCARYRTARVRAKCLRAAAKARAACKRKRSARTRAACLRAVTRRYGPAPKAKRGFTPRTTQGGLGDVMAVTEEDYARPGCEGQGSLQTWQITDERNSDGTLKLKLLDMWTSELNELASATGRSPATGNCSAHWFDEDRGLLAQGWYDQGVRFLDISNPRDIRQVGYYATTGTFWVAYFAPTDPTRQIVYGLDTAGGIDVLRIDRSGKMPTRTVPASAVRAQLARTQTVAAKSPKWRFACAIPQV
jgi:hypothetical protein